MDIERERGITIKLNAARMNYKARDGQVCTYMHISTRMCVLALALA
jgi:translation elongation factor EF-4